MDRTAWIAIILSIIGLVWWNMDFSRKQQERARQHAEFMAEQQQEQERRARSSLGVEDETPATDTAQPGAPQITTSGLPEERVVEIQANDEIKFRLSSRGGLREVLLLNHVDDEGNPISLNTFGSLPIGSILEDPNSPEEAHYDLQVGAATRGLGPEIVLEREVRENVTLRKVLRLPPAAADGDPFLTEMTLTWSNQGLLDFQRDDYFVFVGEIGPIREQEMPHYTGFDFVSQGRATRTGANWFDGSRIPLIGVELRSPAPVYQEERPEISWVGLRNQFYAGILAPVDVPAERVFATRVANRDEDRRQVRHIQGALGMPGFRVESNQSHSVNFKLYTGPREFSRLQRLEADQAQIMNFGWFKWISEILLNSLNWIQSWVGNYAVAIIVLTIIIKLLLYPIQNKAMMEMKRMSLLAPKMKDIREKHKDDPQKMNEEVMALYKDYRVNPFAGCLPMFIQLPIFFGFYSMLGTAVELRHKNFFWVNDLASPDTVAHLGFLPLNLLPLIMAGSMFWQMHITPKTGDKNQMRIFMIMPVIMLLFCYNFASALSLYWTTQNVFSIVQLYLTRNKPLPDLVKQPRNKPTNPLQQRTAYKEKGTPHTRKKKKR
ncbi:MAG: YidC/Oxa1 family insertase periplasmic-domain containing protein [Verrucomicrobiales bacterium]